MLLLSIMAYRDGRVALDSQSRTERVAVTISRINSLFSLIFSVKFYSFCLILTNVPITLNYCFMMSLDIVGALESHDCNFRHSILPS